MQQIRIRGARERTLGNSEIDLPRDSLVVITGLSGSGASPLAFETVYAEARRRDVASLSLPIAIELPDRVKIIVETTGGRGFQHHA